MSRRRRQSASVTGNAVVPAQYVRLENRLVLLAWLNSLLGYKSNKELLDDTKNTPEGFDSDGRVFSIIT